jgi:hypothetical protein
MSFEKIIKTAKSSIKSTTDIAISNCMDFSVQVVPLSDSEGNFPLSEDVYKFADDYVINAMKFQPLNEKAVIGMKTKWIKTHGTEVPFVPKRQPSELVVVLIAPYGETEEQGIHLFYSVPKSINFTVPEVHSQSQREQTEGPGRIIYYANIVAPEGTTLFKYRDQLSQEILNNLKTQKIYVEDDSDDDDPAYCI